jgi:6-phosphogluconolactonase/glucosamine-6-phosphate isomerase/deaminase
MVKDNRMVDIHSYSDAPAATRMATEALRDTLIASREKSVLFLISGGSSLQLLSGLSPDLFDSRVTMGILDERYSRDPQINNFAQFANTELYAMAMKRGVACIDTFPKEGESIDDLAARWEGELKTWRMSHADGTILIAQGIGPDGHTAGMMPYPDDKATFVSLFENPTHWVTGYDAGNRNKYPLRVTVTMPFLRSVDAAVVYAVGAEKKGAITAMLAPHGTIHETPARIVHEMPHCLLYTDQAVDTVKI